MADSSPLIIEPRQARAADATVILLHGLGADGHDFEPLVPALPLAKDLAVRFVLPHAPRMPLTVNGGMEMPAWYDILDMNLGRPITELRMTTKLGAFLLIDVLNLHSCFWSEFEHF